MCVIYHLVVITRSSGLIKYFIPANNLQQYRTKRKKKDYLSLRIHFSLIFYVIKTILDLLAVEPDVCQITVDFEKALWSVLQQVLPGVKIEGCVFHWTQALCRKVGLTCHLIICTRKNFELFAIQILQPCFLIYFLQIQELGL